MLTTDANTANPMQDQRTVAKLTLYSLLPPQAILSQLESGFVAEPSDRDMIQQLWERATAKYAKIGPSSRSFSTIDDIQPIKQAYQAEADAMLRRARCYPPYDSHSTDIYMVRISKLVTPQITVNVSRAEKRAHIKPGMPTDELLSLMFQSGGTPERITRQALGMAPNGGAVLFTSYDEDIRLHHPPQYRSLPISDRDPESPSFDSVSLSVGGGVPFGAAYRMEVSPGVTRLILANGIHRAFELAKAGYQWCPLLLSDLIPLELPEQFVDLPRDILLHPAANPPLITDFLNKDVTIPLEYFRVLKTIRLNWGFEQYVTVLR